MHTSYPYTNQSLTPKNAQPLIVELFGDKGKTKKKSIVDAVTQTHLERGGLLPIGMYIYTSRFGLTISHRPSVLHQ